MSIANTWWAAIIDRGIVIPGRAQLMMFQWGQVRLGLLNLYAPNHESARAEFLMEIVDALPRADEWCIGGDVNMIEAPEDRCGSSETTIHGTQLAAWERLCMTLRIVDVWHAGGFAREGGSLLFSRSDRRIGSTNLSRLDRMYSSDLLVERGGSVGILAGTCMSEHAPVLLVLSEGNRRFSQSMRIPKCVQIDERLDERIEQIWRQTQLESAESRAQSLAMGLERISAILREEAGLRLARLREAERRLHRSVASLQRLLERHPDSEWAGDTAGTGSAGATRD